MIHCLHVPLPCLSEYIDFFWYHEGVTTENHKDKLLPDGSIQLIIDLTETPKKLFHSDSGEPATEFKRAWISGSHTKFIVIEGPKDSCMIGLQFKPAGAFPFFRIPLSEIYNSVVPMADYFPALLTDLRESLLEKKTVAEKFALLEQRMITLLNHSKADNGALRVATDTLSSSPKDISIKQLSDKIGYSHKHLISLFDRYIGISPKQYQRVAKFQMVLKQIEKSGSIQWTDIAYGCGYYDQSHFIKDFQGFSGLNPRQYLDRRGDYFGYIPIYH